jgi:phosphoribosylaminoimidazole-succinocarboxamide synthase
VTLLYEGKAKQVFSVSGEPDLVRMEFKDSLTAFNAQKKGDFPAKGMINCQIATLIFQKLIRHGIESHFVRSEGDRAMIVKQLIMLPLEVVVRNRVAGSLAERLGIAEGKPVRAPIVEFYYKNDALADPLVTAEQVESLGLLPHLSISQTHEVLLSLQAFAKKLNQALIKIWQQVGLELVDFKFEVGTDKDGRLLLADEITPDSCRLWDLKTQEKFDKDRFRRDLGGVAEAYHEVLRRLKTDDGGRP